MTKLDRAGKVEYCLGSSPCRAPHRCIMQHFDNLATSYYDLVPRGMNCNNQQQELGGRTSAATEMTWPLRIGLLVMSREDSTTSWGRSRTVGTPALFRQQ